MREGCSLDVKSVLLGYLYDGADLSDEDVVEIIQDTVSDAVVHLVNESTILYPLLMRDSPFIPDDAALFFSRVANRIDLKVPLKTVHDAQERIGGLISCIVTSVKISNLMLFSHVPRGKLPDWEKRYEGLDE